MIKLTNYRRIALLVFIEITSSQRFCSSVSESANCCLLTANWLIFQDEQSKGSGDSDGFINNIRLFTCEKNNGMFVNIGQITLVPPKRPSRRPKKRAPSTPSLSSENNFLTNGSQLSDQYTNDLVSRTESELSFMDDVNSAETVPLVDLQVGDRVLWPSDHGDEEASVRWIGTLPDKELEGEILVGVEFVSILLLQTVSCNG